jgi:hypothetical protein
MLTLGLNRWVMWALLAYWFASGNDFAIQTIANSSPPPAQLTAEQDHQRTLNLLHITSLRLGPDGDPKSPHAANLDESKATSYTNLPDPLLLKRGKKVRSEKIWWKLRRPEIVEDFDREIYGRVPPNAPSVNWQVTSTTREMNDAVPVITKKIVGHVDNSSYPLVTVDIQLTLTTPAQAAGPVPVIMELTQGIIGLVNKGQPRTVDDWGALRAWAWGASRALDYFVTDRSVDAGQVGIESLSRYGKAALVTMAYDPRFALAFVGSSGAGGQDPAPQLWRAGGKRRFNG